MFFPNGIVKFIDMDTYLYGYYFIMCKMTTGGMYHIIRSFKINDENTLKD